MTLRYFIAVGAASLALTAQSAPMLSRFEAQVTLSADGSAKVEARIQIEGRPAASPTPMTRLTLLRYEGQTISGLTAFDGQERILPLSTSTVGTTLRVEIPETTGAPEFLLRYRVSGGERIPLPVPDAAPRSGEHPAEVVIRIPDGHQVAGSVFPPLSDDLRTRMSGVPSFVRLRTKAAFEITLADRWLTASTVADAAILGLILISAAWWFWRSRRES